MARIPVTQEPSVRTEGLPTPYARPFATPQGQGAGFGDVLEGAAHVGSEYVQDARQRADAANIQGAWGQGQDALNKTILDPEKGYSSLRGSDAMAGREKALGSFNKALDGINEKLTPDQQRMFEPHLRALREQGYTHVIAHEAREQESYAQGNFKGNVDSTMETMQMPQIVADPDQLKASVGKLFQAGIDEGKRRYGTDASKEAIQSVVDPMLQQAALGGMQAALTQAEQSGDPTIAKNAFDVLGKYLLKNHNKQIGGMVEALTAKAAIATGAKDIIGGSVSSTMVPGGDSIALVDGDRFAAKVAAIPLDTPHREEIVKAAEDSRKRLDTAKDAAIGTVVQRILKGGDPQAIGDFRLDRPGVSAVDRMWLRDVDEKKLIALRDMQDREATKTRRERETDSLANYNNLITMMRDETQRRNLWGPMSPDQFRAKLLDGDTFPGGFSDKQVKAAQVAFNTLKNEVGRPQEPVQTAVSEIIKATFKGNQNAAKDYVGPIHDEVVNFIASEKQKHNGVAPDPAAVRAHGLEQLARGSITKVGEAPGFLDFNSTRLIDFLRKPEFVGKQFNPQGGGPVNVREGVPGAAVPAQIPVRSATPVTTARKPTRTVNGVTKEWNGAAWVSPGSP
jgi:hypothetical protein